MLRKLPELADIITAKNRSAAYVKVTPVLTSTFFNDLCGCALFFKCENFQKIGAFKFRGAMNALATLPRDQLKKGVVTHSSGNHGQAVGLAARIHGTKAVIVMPSNSVPIKVDAIKGYGAEVVFCEPGGSHREDTTAALIAAEGMTLVHPYNDPAVIAGQGTAFLEFNEQTPNLDIVMTPVGGGGLLSGTAIAAKGLLKDRIEVWGGEPAGADDAYRSLAAGKIVANESVNTVADGLRSTSLGDLTFAAIKQHVNGILTVSDDDILSAMRLVWQRMKIVIEPSSAVPLAALINHKDRFKGKRVGVVLTGGNVVL